MFWEGKYVSLLSFLMFMFHLILIMQIFHLAAAHKKLYMTEQELL